MISIKIVTKPWGQEEWVSDGVRMPYALKRITFRAGHRTSLQVHAKKKETNLVISGQGTLYIGRTMFPIDAYLLGMMDDHTLQWYMEDMDTIDLVPGVAFDVNPQYIHRVSAESDLVFIEASTPELDDVLRLQDDTKRRHGKIDREHG